MACVFYDGFDHYTTADVLKMWTSTGAGATFSVGASFARQPSGQGYNATTGAATFPFNLGKTFGTNYSQGVLGFAVYFTSATTVARTVCAVGDGTTEQISVRLNTSGVLTVNQATTVIATGTTVLSTATWYYVELKFLISQTVGYVGLHLNGAVEIATTAANKDTTGSANAQWNAIAIGANGAVTAYYDDLYCLDTSTGSNTDYLGPVRVATIYPASPGTHTDWTPNGGTNVGNVSEPYQDGDTSFNQSATANQIDSFVFGQIPASTGSVFSAAHVITGRQDSGAQRTFSPMQRRSADTVSATVFSPSTSIQMFMDIKDQDPEAGPGDWTVSNFNATEFGEKLIS